MKKVTQATYSVIFASISLILTVLVSCGDTCDIEQGNSLIEFTFIDSTGENLFLDKYAIDSLIIKDDQQNTINFEIDSVRRTIIFPFRRNIIHNQEFSTDYNVILDSSRIEPITLIYQTQKVNHDCGGWRFKYVKLIHEDSIYTRNGYNEIILIEI